MFGGVTFRSHVTLGAVSLPRFSMEEKGKGTTWRQDHINVKESDIADTTIRDNQELKIACLVSLWHNQDDSNTVDNAIGHKDVMGRLITGSWH